jgi:hypothetical protein
MAASAGDGGASNPTAGDDDGSNPIIVDPGKGWRVVLPLPREVVAKLGGPAQLGERVRSIHTSLGQSGQLTGEASDNLASAVDELLRHLEAVTGQEGRG